MSDLLCVARSVEIPDWATHVAVRTDGSKSEPAAWVEDIQDYVDEDPAGVPKGGWIGSYKHYYWKFFSREELST